MLPGIPCATLGESSEVVRVALVRTVPVWASLIAVSDYFRGMESGSYVGFDCSSTPAILSPVKNTPEIETSLAVLSGYCGL